jgi:uncharacterized membrane protein
MKENPEKYSSRQERQTSRRNVNPEIIPPGAREKLGSPRNITALVYIFQAISVLVGITSIVGVIINYVKLNDVRGTWLETHFRWQIRTFWFVFLWGILGGLTVGIGIGFLILIANSIWLIYRVVKGWLYLNDGRRMYP